MKYSWSKTVVPIAALFSFRMLGLFLLIPVFTLYAGELNGATPALIGIALGAYGLSQGILQMPLGMLSDRWGRKPIITIGLVLFAIGSLVGALSHSIYGVILARILQGTGAIGSVLIALLADLTPDKDRTRAMAVIGMTIGMSFSLAMVISPALTSRFGLSGIFYLTACLAVIGLVMLHLTIPTPQKERFHGDSEANPALFKSVITNPNLLRLNLGIFCQHYILTSTFFLLPLILHKHTQQRHLEQAWHFYFLIIVLAFIFMVPFIIFSERKNRLKLVYLGSVISTIFTQLMLQLTYQSWYALCLFMFLYFVAFNILEALLPSQISKQANPRSKGTAMGIYSTSQFLGIFIGGSTAGLLYQWNGRTIIFLSNAILSMIWFIASYSMKAHPSFATLIVPYQNIQDHEETLIARLSKLAGVQEVVLAKDEEIIYLKIDKNLYLEGSAEHLLRTL